MNAQPRRAAISLGTKINRFVFLLCAIALFVFTANGFAAFLKVEKLSGLEWWYGWLKAGTPALIVVAALTLSLAKWHQKKSAITLLFIVLFFSISFAASMNYWFRSMRGEVKTVEIFDVQRDGAVKQMSSAHDHIDNVVTALFALATESRQKADTENSDGNTCERQTAKIKGPRYRFRRDDAARFEGIYASVKHIPSTLKDKIAAAQAIKPLPGEKLAHNVSELRSAVNATESAQLDPALEQAKKELTARVADDGKPRKDGNVTFSCPDESIRTQAEAAVKRIEGFSKLKMPSVEIPDFSEVADSLKVFSLAYDTKSWGKPGGLSISDGIALLIAIAIELGMASTASAFSLRLAGENVIDRLPDALDRDPTLTLAVVRALGDDPDAKVREVMTLIERHEKRLFGFRRLVVLYGSEDAEVSRLAWNASIMERMGLIEADSFIFASLRVRASLPYWFQRKHHNRMEIFRIKDDAFDEIRLREFVARVRATLSDTQSPEPPRQDNEPQWQQAAE